VVEFAGTFAGSGTVVTFTVIHTAAESGIIHNGTKFVPVE
jgi:uncharacterized OB-fold protein